MNQVLPSAAANPSLDRIASDPSCAHELPHATVITLLRRVAVIQSALVAELEPPHEERATKRPAEPADEWLDEKSAAKLLHRPTRWLFRNASRLPFVSRISRKHLLVSRKGVERWLAARRS
jgi:hypothetical protein